MRKKIFAILFILLIGLASAEYFRPETVKAMDVTITTKAAGSFSGTITRGDSMEVYYLSINDDKDQEVKELEEYLEIGDKKIQAEKTENNGVKYAKYVIPDLYEYASTPQFTIIRKARIKKTAKIGIDNDYNLENKISEYAELKKETDYIETNDQELQSKAISEFTDDSEIETIRKITEWVNTNIEYDFQNYYNGIYSAKETYNSRAGVCDEFANLTAAFMRIRGIPTKYITGISYDGERFGLHGWVEVYLPGQGWIGVDSTYGEAGYLDGAHFSIAKTEDANKAIDLIVKTTSRKTVNVQTKLELPEVQINSVEFFENLFEKGIEVKRKVQPNETFEIKASIKNKSGKNAIFPVELLLHEDFEVIKPARLLYFENDEEKEIIWLVKAPNKEVKKGYYTYEVYLMLPDGNVSDEIQLIPKVKITESPNILTQDVSPFLRETFIEIKINLKNFGQKKGDATIKIEYNNEETSNRKITIESGEETTVTEKVQTNEKGTIKVTIQANREEVYEIQIPEKTAIIEPKPIEAVEVKPEKAPETEFIEDNKSMIMILAAGAGVLFIGLVFMILRLK
ncbi:MAG: hypothetical protein COV47_02475 [Candidatus Diapherotrites archaeon CG11_big_fil_rev_8_21_14_0_20_37_9]|nr:MAG: hypothetical protein COV47_02475 [Candidatus Diapherotrites archaeon CG11_big_fil_rev_8_21_14_0_20_37_9]